MESEKLAYLEELEKKEDYVALIKEIKNLIAEDKRAMTDPFIKKWCGRRWRNILLTEAVHDEVALKSAIQKGLPWKKDKRPDRQKIAERYLKGDERNEWQLEMPAVERPEKFNTTLVFSPGLLTGQLPVRAFKTPFPIVEKKLNIRILRSDIHPMRGCEANVDDLVQTIEKGTGFTSDVQPISEEDAVPPGDFFLMGYSKGMPDLMTLLVKRPDLKDRVRCIYNWGGAVGGSYLANDIYESIKDIELPMVEEIITGLLLKVFPFINEKGLLRRFDEFDIKTAVYDITTPPREQFVKDHAEELDAMDIPIFTITGSTTVMNVPYFQIQGVMALNKYDANNDMQLTQSEAKLEIPMATHLVMLNAHHWDMSYDPFPKLMRFGSPNLDHPFPKEAAATAIILLVYELGLID